MAATIIRPGERRLEPVGSSTAHAQSPAAPSSPATGAILRQIVCDDRPYVHLVEVPAHHRIAPHRHSEAEVTIILSGSARIAGTDCEPGTVIVIPAEEDYAIDVGAQPLTMVVVRPARAQYRWSEPEHA